MYARHGEDVIILVGHPEKKTWWRNFTDEGDIEVLLERQWVPMTARAVIGAEDFQTAEPLVDAYLTRFPRAASVLGDEVNGSHAKDAVVVLCQPR